MKILKYILMMTATLAITEMRIEDCPEWVRESKRVSDLGMISEAVSWDSGYEQLIGFCGTYEMVEETHGIYDTRMRVYENIGTDVSVIVFRPTQQNPDGGNIHVDRRLVPCRLAVGCVGRVHDRFQQAFLDLLSQSAFSFPQDREYYLTGHSLGGSLQIFMGVHLWLHHNILPTMMIGLAGPFIGDEEFTQTYQHPLRAAMEEQWWQIETVDDASQRDGTVEGYNTNQPPFIFIDETSLCLLPIASPIPGTYGMHDLTNYREGLYH